MNWVIQMSFDATLVGIGCRKDAGLDVMIQVDESFVPQMLEKAGSWVWLL